MPRLTIRKENRPTRCEICHQSDLFDSNTGKCQRCENIPLPIEQITPLPPYQIAITQSSLDFTALGAASLGILAFVPGLFFPPIGLFLGIIAAILGIRALGRIRNSAETLSGESFAYIAVYCGSLAAILGFLLFLFILRRSYF